MSKTTTPPATESSTTSTTATAPAPTAPAPVVASNAATPVSNDAPTGIAAMLESLKLATEPVKESPEKEAEAPEKQAEPKTEPKAESKAEPKPGDAGKEPEAETSKQEEESPEEAEEIKRELDDKTKGMSPAHKAAFTNLRYEARDFKRHLKQAQAELEALKAAGEPTGEARAELDALQKTNAELQERLATFESDRTMTRLEHTSEFRQKVAEPRTEAANEAEALAKKYNIPVADMVKALDFRDAELRDEAVERVVSEMGERDKYRFFSVADRIEKTDQVEIEMRWKGAEELSRIERDEKARASMTEKQARESWDKATEKVWDSFVDDYPILQPIEGDEEWNDYIGKIRSYAKEDQASRLPVADRVELHYRAAAFPVLASEVEAMAKEIEALKKELSGFKGSEPGLPGGSGEAGAGNGSSKDQYKGMSFADRVAARIGKGA